jgi:spore photoproduct lyase
MAGGHLRWTSKFTTPALVEPLLELPHAGRTRVRASVNAEPVARRFEGGTAPVAERLAGLARLAEARYPVGLVIAPIVLDEGWEGTYGRLLDDAAAALPCGCDLTIELITHRFTPGSREVLRGWYPNSALEMEPAGRAEKRGKFGAVKYVYGREAMRGARTWFERAVAERLAGARVLYWT